METSGEKPSLWQRLRETVGHSAEYVIALALIVVCVVVGVVAWVASPDDAADAAHVRSAELALRSAAGAADAARLEEEAVLQELKRQLRSSVIDAEDRKRLEAEVAERERRRLQAAQAAARAAAAPAPTPAPSPAAPGDDAQGLAEVLGLADPAVPTRPAAVRTTASIDWSSCRRPQYPRAAEVARQQGVVVLSFDLDAAGIVRRGVVEQSSGFERLDQAALKAIGQCRFRPATVDNTAEASTTLVRFAWQLQ